MLRMPQLNETVSSDTWFSSVTSIEGYNCGQSFCGSASHCMNVYGMKSEFQFSQRYQDFIRENGIPHTLRRDNAKAEDNEAVKAINRDYIIKDEFTEPHHPHQNPVELRMNRFIKKQSQIIMDRTGCPSNLWFRVAKYICDVYNHTADESLGWKTPLQVRRGDTVDISHILQFQFFEPILYLDPEEKFPYSKEKPGYFVGWEDNVGDALTYVILTKDKKTLLHRSMVRSALDSKNRNRRVHFDEPLQSELDSKDPEPEAEGFPAAKNSESTVDILYEAPRTRSQSKTSADRTRSKVNHIGILTSEKLENKT